jgi:hypothetical protein
MISVYAVTMGIDELGMTGWLRLLHELLRMTMPVMRIGAGSVL